MIIATEIIVIFVYLILKLYLISSNYADDKI